MQSIHIYRNHKLEVLVFDEDVLILNKNDLEEYFQEQLEKHYNNSVHGFLEAMFFTEDNIRFTYEIEEGVWTVHDFLNRKIVELKKDAKKYYDLRNNK